MVALEMRSDTITTPALREIRTGLLLTQKELARKASVSELTILRAESGLSVSFATVKKLAAALERPPEKLTSDTDNEDPDKPP